MINAIQRMLDSLVSIILENKSLNSVLGKFVAYFTFFFVLLCLVIVQGAC